MRGIIACIEQVHRIIRQKQDGVLSKDIARDMAISSRHVEKLCALLLSSRVLRPNVPWTPYPRSWDLPQIKVLQHPAGTQRAVYSSLEPQLESVALQAKSYLE